MAKMTQNTKKKPRIRVYSTDMFNKKDKKCAKIMQKFLDKEWERYGDVIETIVMARTYIEKVYPFIRTPDRIWDRIAEAVIQFDIKNNL